MTPAQIADAQRVRLAVGRFARRLRQLFLEDTGLPALELGVLQRLSEDGPLSPSQLSELEAVTGPAIAQALRRLEYDGMVTTAANVRDRRRVEAAITTLGAKALQTRKSDVAARIEAALDSALDAEQRRELMHALTLLEKVGRAL